MEVPHCIKTKEVKNRIAMEQKLSGDCGSSKYCILVSGGST